MMDSLDELKPLQRLIVAYAKSSDRERYALLFALDGRFAEIVRSTSEILIGQMRLTWWRDILTNPAAGRPLGEPLIATINRLEAQGTSLAPLRRMLDGWEAMLEDFPWDERQIANYASARGPGFFQFGLPDGQAMTAAQTEIATAWALWDFARHCSDPAMRSEAFARCQAMVRAQGAAHFDRSGRPLSILCRLMARDVRNGDLAADLYTPASAARIVWHGLAGR